MYGIYVYIFCYLVKGGEGYGVDGIKCELIRNKLRLKQNNFMNLYVYLGYCKLSVICVNFFS